MLSNVSKFSTRIWSLVMINFGISDALVTVFFFWQCVQFDSTSSFLEFIKLCYWLLKTLKRSFMSSFTCLIVNHVTRLAWGFVF